MIDPKYAQLPGIAYDQPDVYETEDNKNEKLQNLPQEDSDSVEKILTTTIDAYQKFKNKHVDSQTVDFSNKISSEAKIGYQVTSGGQDETPYQKFNRIKMEFEELMNDINSVKAKGQQNEESRFPADLIQQIKSLDEQMNSTSIEKLLDTDSIAHFHNYQGFRLKELMSQIEIFKQKKYGTDASLTKSIPLQSEKGAVGALKYQMVYSSEKAKVQDIARISHLEKRLGCLENIIGATSDSVEKCPHIFQTKGIMKSVEKLMATAYLLNSSQLDIIENRVTSLTQKIDNIVQKKEMVSNNTKQDEQITNIYKVMKQSEDYLQILPQTVDRLMSLSNLHQKAADFSERIKELENLKQSIDESLMGNKSLLEDVQKNFISNLQTMANDITSLNNRITELKK